MIEVGTKLNNRYKIVRFIGSGGMATVYLAHDLILDRPVAVKVLRLDFSDDQAALRRFQREARSVSELNHENIVNMYDVGEDEKRQFIVMEYVEGTDLKRYIRQHQPISLPEIVDIMIQITSAVSAAHQRRIIHRDLKTQNILISRKGVVKITDFGISVALSDNTMTQTNTLLGSVHYLSPEQARGSMATVKSDIYALGIILYELIMGKVPFDGDSAVSIALQHFQKTMPSVVAQSIQHVPQSLENVILKATAKDPMHRYDSCQDMLFDLQTVLRPDRRYEEPFRVSKVEDETRVLQPITNKIATPKIDKPKIVVPDVAHKSQNSQWFKKTVMGLLALITVLLSGFMIYTNFFADTAAVIPNVASKTQAEAVDVLTKAGFIVEEKIEQADDKIQENLVIDTNPKAGEKAKKSSKVTLVVSTGPATAVIEDYTQKDYDVVQKQLVAKGYTVERSTEYSDTVAAGKILSQNIAAGSKVTPHKTTIKFVVSKGLEEIAMDNFLNQKKSVVEDFIQKNKLQVVYDEKYSDDIEEGYIMNQYPKEGSKLTKGDQLSITVSLGKKTERYINFSKSVLIPYLASDSTRKPNDKAKNTVLIYIEDAEHTLTEVYKTLEITESQNINLTFNIKEGASAKFKIERDGKIISENSHVTP